MDSRENVNKIGRTRKGKRQFWIFNTFLRSLTTILSIIWFWTTDGLYIFDFFKKEIFRLLKCFVVDLSISMQSKKLTYLLVLVEYCRLSESFYLMICFLLIFFLNLPILHGNKVEKYVAKVVTVHWSVDWVIFRATVLILVSCLVFTNFFVASTRVLFRFGNIYG